MRDAHGFSRHAARMNLPSPLTIVGDVSGDPATTFEVDIGVFMRTQSSTPGWVEIYAAPSGRGSGAWLLAFWWIMGCSESSCPLLDQFMKILTVDAIYFRQRGTIRSLSHLSDSLDHWQAMRISDIQIAKLQQLLKQHFGLDYSAEEAQVAGRAILRFVGLKLYQQLERGRPQDKNVDQLQQ